MKNKEKSSGGLDLFSPVVEIFHELCVLLITVLIELGKVGFKKLMNQAPDVEKIDRKALKVMRETNSEEALGIDTKTKKEIKLGEIDFSKHSFIVGASGFGKTNLISILQENSLRNKKPIIFIDPKGDAEALDTFRRLCEHYDRSCYVFSEHDPDSISLNPVLEGTESQVSDRIMGAFVWSEEFYKDACRRSLNSALAYLKMEDKTFTLKNIYDYLCAHETKENLGIITKIENILKSDFGKILNADVNGLTISKIRKERSCLYIGLSVQGYGETAVAIGKLFLGELLFNSYSTLLNKGEESLAKTHPISIYFDEFGSLVTTQFIELENKCRGAGMELTMAVQTASDINRVDPELTNQVIENTANFFILKQRLQANAEVFSEAIGTILSKKQTYKVENGEKQDSASEREVHELIVHPDVIKNLGVGQCVLLRQGKPTKVNLINIRNREKSVMKKIAALKVKETGAFDFQ